MNKDSDVAYHLARELQERDAAVRSGDMRVRALHYELAYRHKLSALVTLTRKPDDLDDAADGSRNM